MGRRWLCAEPAVFVGSEPFPHVRVKIREGRNKKRKSDNREENWKG